MQVDIRYSPAFAVGVIAIPAGGEIKAEAGAMTSMSGGVEIETKAQGGVMAGLKRSVLGGESFFINTFRAPQGGELTVSPTLPGDLSWSYGLAVRLMLRQVDLLWERGMLDYLLLHGSKPAAGPGRG